MPPDPSNEQQPATEAILAQLVETEMCLPIAKPDGPRVFVFDQAFPIPADSGILVVTRPMDSTPFGSALYYESLGDQLFEVQEENCNELLAITIYSYSDEANRRREEVRFALRGTLAIQTCEKYAIAIQRLSKMSNISEAEGPKMLNRWECTLLVQRRYERRKPVDSFNIFENPPDQKRIKINP